MVKVNAYISEAGDVVGAIPHKSIYKTQVWCACTYSNPEDIQGIRFFEISKLRFRGQFV